MQLLNSNQRRFIMQRVLAFGFMSAVFLRLGVDEPIILIVSVASMVTSALGQGDPFHTLFVILSIVSSLLLLLGAILTWLEAKWLGLISIAIAAVAGYLTPPPIFMLGIPVGVLLVVSGVIGAFASKNWVPHPLWEKLMTILDVEPPKK